MKEEHKVTLNRVMEIARLEVSTQHHLDRMQETAKVNYIQYGKGKKSTQFGASSHRGDRGHGMVLNPVERVKSFHSHKTLATDVGKADAKRYGTAKLWMQCAGAVERKDTLKRCASRSIPHTH